MKPLVDRILENLNENYKHGFDLTDFDSVEDFEALLKKHKLKGGSKTKDGFEWKSPSILLVTYNNPITGEYAGGSRSPEQGYASYVGIEGDEKAVKSFVKDMKKVSDSKDESPGSRDFV